MCGIVGFLGKRKAPQVVEKMLETQAHRGRDGRGIWMDEIAQKFVHLGHNRLAIQDTSSDGHQPFVSSCGEYILVFNGEVYNFKVIRIELEKLGYAFVSQSDTEVILYAYKAWGIGCLEKFIGMFAFCLVDKKANKMYLVRDRAGVKPLYYYALEEKFIFSSEIKSFHRHQGFTKVLHKEVLPYYFQMGYIPAPHSIFKNLYKLEAGKYLCYDLAKNTYEKIVYWEVSNYYQKEKFDNSEAEILNDLETLLEDAVSQRMVSDVPVGIFLSGGYDSSLVTALLAQNHKDLHTFTIGFNDKNYNEAQDAKQIASYLGTKHEEYYVDNKDLLSNIESLPFYYDEPFGDSSALPTMLVSKLASQKVKVVLSADGGDESFCGYSKYFFLEKFSSVFSSHFRKILLKHTLNNISAKRMGQINNFFAQSL
ncbi:MAG: asparagine synthase (glutamine-hydrolyzing) [Sulfurovum sp.]|nr:asparagine synthase (glutamine-hydrolyzing) [Sulfurovum sp.]